MHLHFILQLFHLWIFGAKKHKNKIEKSKTKKISRKIRGFLIKKMQHYLFLFFYF